MTKLEQEIKQLESKRKDLIAELGEKKEEFINFLNRATNKRLLNMQEYNSYKDFTVIVKAIEETDIKIRTITYCSQLTEHQ